GQSGVSLELRVRVRSARTGPELTFDAEGIPGLKWGLASAPVDGKANTELEREVASFFRVPRSRVSLLRGEKSKKKVLFISELMVEDVLARLGAKRSRGGP
ncbi:MAG TPA: DUF167 domain-containing protein, partial [Oligoflexia bacterium]|nr:DUF167 domain-containing protein [Oligoflexia bacterium]